MKTYIAIDGGTTNTRISLVKNREVVDTVKLSMGARTCIENGDMLKTEIKRTIETLLKNHSENDVTCVLASGMITSEFGLCSLPHIETPAGINELHSSMHRTVLEDISPIPFVFIRGVKVPAESFENADVMRGEETELMGLIKLEYGKCIYVLPGSHSKIIRTDESGKIVDFSTMLTGEMIYSLSQHTILKDAVDLSVCELNKEYLLRGFDYCREDGINKALFKTRILKNIFGCSKEETYSFFLGAVLSQEIEQIIKFDVGTVVLGGKAEIKTLMAEILKERDTKKIVLLDENEVARSTALGAVRIFEGSY